MSTQTVIQKVKQAIRQPLTFPGLYPLSIILSDGHPLCPDCAKGNFRQVARDTFNHSGDWNAVAVDIMWEGGNECCHCGKCLDAYPADAEEEGGTEYDPGSPDENNWTA